MQLANEVGEPSGGRATCCHFAELLPAAILRQYDPLRSWSLSRGPLDALPAWLPPRGQ